MRMGNTKHLVYVLPYLEQGGTEKQALSLIAEFQQRYQISLNISMDFSVDLFLLLFSSFSEDTLLLDGNKTETNCSKIFNEFSLNWKEMLGT